MRAYLLPLVVLAACSTEGGAPPPGDTGESSALDTGGSTPLTRPDVDVTYDVELTASGVMTDLIDPRMSMVSTTNNYPYILEAPSSDQGAYMVVHYLMGTYVYPTGADDIVDDWCVDGEYDDKAGVCRGKLWTAGRVATQRPTQYFCLDQVNGRMFLVKDQGTRLEIADTAMEGEEAYSYNFAAQKIDYQPSVTDLGKFLGRCEYLPYADQLVLTGNGEDSSATVGFAKIDPTAMTGELVDYVDLGMVPEFMYATNDGRQLVLNDIVSDEMVRLNTDDFTVEASWPVEGLVHFGINRRTGMAYLAKGDGGATMLDTTNPSATEVPITGVTTATVEWAFADPTRNTAWLVGTDDGVHYTVFVAKDGVVTGSMEVTGAPVVDVAEPGDMGDLVVVQMTGTAGSGAWQVFAAKPDQSDGRPPVNVFLYTTIEEPSDANLFEDDAKTRYNCDYYEAELALIRGNAAQLASLRTAAGNPVPIAMAITDNFAEISRACGGYEEIYDELQNKYHFQLGVMLHNRPCYNCSSSDGTPDADGLYANPDYCGADDGNFIAPTNTSACFPDDPDYCSRGDYDCYYRFLAPRVEIADQNIPGGGAFIVGADRHGLWDYDWIRFYQTVERPSMDHDGFDLTLFVGDWAYTELEFGDPREKNPATWRPQDRSAIWRPGQINDWSRDSAYSNLVYLPGINSSTNKIGEQQASSLFMVDFVNSGISIAYGGSDLDVQWQHLRQAVNYRKIDHVNSWYWHIHDQGLSNLVGGAGAALPMSDDPKTTVAQALQRFVDEIDARYVATGEVQWAYPTEIRDEYQACCTW